MSKATHLYRAPHDQKKLNDVASNPALVQLLEGGVSATDQAILVAELP
jgi:hypothetical protein